MKADRDPKRIDVKTYKDKISTLVGSHISLISNPNGHTQKNYEGIVEYASSSHFGIKISTNNGEYVQSFSYIDVYTKKIIIQHLFD